MLRIASAVVLLAAVAAKPVYLRLPDLLAAAKLVAEVEVLALPAAAGVGADAVIRVRVTADPRGLLKGHGMLGRELALHPPSFGPQRCIDDLAQRPRNAGPLLVVVDQRDAIVIFGRMVECVGGARGYELWSYCDHNAAIVVPVDNALLGAPQAPLADEDHICVRAGGLIDRLADARRNATVPAARVLVVPAERLPEAELARLLVALGASDTAAADAAEQRLVATGAGNLDALRRARAQNRDAALDARLGRVLDAHAAAAAAHDLAKAYHAAGRNAEAWLLCEVVPATEDAELRRYGRAWLRAFADQAGLAGESDEEVAAAVSVHVGLTQKLP